MPLRVLHTAECHHLAFASEACFVALPAFRFAA